MQWLQMVEYLQLSSVIYHYCFSKEKVIVTNKKFPRQETKVSTAQNFCLDSIKTNESYRITGNRHRRYCNSISGRWLYLVLQK